MDVNILNTIIALARLLGVKPQDLAAKFNEREDNGEFLGELVLFQEIMDRKKEKIGD